MKKLLILGGAKYLLPLIKAAHSLGLYVITCDYLPDNIAHKYSDEYHNVSIIDKEAVLELAKNLQVDGIMSFATDPGVVVAAYVCEKLGLPTCPLESVKILQNKDLFRKFLKENNFNVPYAMGFDNKEDVKNSIAKFKFPVIVKPVDSAGSKGVKRADTLVELFDSIEYALKYSLSNRFIIEEFIEKLGASSDTDCFSIDNKLVFNSFSSQLFDKYAKNPYVPAGYIWPSNMNKNNQENLSAEIGRLIKLLNLGTSIYNVETRIGIDGKEYIMELTPRGGGNRLSEMLKFSSGQDLILNNIKFAVGLPLDKMEFPKYNGVWAEYIIHSNKSGYFKNIIIDKNFESKYIYEKDIWIKEKEYINDFYGANDAIGTLILKFDSYEEAEYSLLNPDWISIEIE